MTDLVQMKVYLRPEQRDRVDVEIERRKPCSPSAIVRAALDYYFESLPPAPAVGVDVLDEAIADFDRATLEP